MEKIYVKPDNNKTPNFLLSHIRVGNTVIVTDGSYMTYADKTKEGKPCGNDFRRGSRYELLTVTRVNVPFRTYYNYYNDNDPVLARHNNCEIVGNDGVKYYCSLINIRRYTL